MLKLMDRSARVLKFIPREEKEEEVSKELSHISISFHPTGIRIKEERGLDEYLTTVQTKEELIKHLQEKI